MDEKKDSEKYLEFLCNLAPLLQKLIPVDCIIGITDKEKFICSLSGENISLPVNRVGTPLMDTAPIAKAMKEKKALNMISPKEIIGVEFQATTIPIFDMEGNVIGGIGLGVELGKKNVVSKNADHVARASNFVKKNIEELSDSAEELEKRQKSLLNLTNVITNQINETKRIIEIINKIANTSKILGLNATIEASRAGEMGKGFSVVAKEMRKMAEDSTKAVIEVGNMLNEIKEKIMQIDNEVNQTTEIGSIQAEATRELSKTVMELSDTASILQDAAKNIVG